MKEVCFFILLLCKKLHLPESINTKLGFFDHFLANLTTLHGLFPIQEIGFLLRICLRLKKGGRSKQDRKVCLYKLGSRIFVNENSHTSELHPINHEVKKTENCSIDQTCLSIINTKTNTDK